MGRRTPRPQPLPFTRAWANTAQITASDGWSGVPGVIGYRGDDLTAAIGADPQTILAGGTATPVDVNANRTDPNTFIGGAWRLTRAEENCQLTAILCGAILVLKVNLRTEHFACLTSISALTSSSAHFLLRMCDETKEVPR